MLREKGKVRKNLKMKKGGGVTAVKKKKSLHLDLDLERGERGRQTRSE